MIAILADAFVKATILLLFAAGGTLLLRRSSAALRHLVWALACGGALVLPVASALLPNWRVAAWPRLDAPVSFKVAQIAAEPQTSSTAAPQPDHPRPSAVTIVETPTADLTLPTDAVRFRITPDWKALVFPIWLSGVTAILLLVLVGMARVAWLDRVTPPVQDDEWLLLVEDLSRELGLTRYVRLLRANVPAMPMTWGIRRPAILLPAEADQWSDEQRRDVLLHELAHVKRHDFLIQLIARIACAVYWFHPLVWLAATRLREERERACDDQVLRAGATPSVYATHLLEIARGLRAARATSLASVAMARPAQLATRLIDVLDARRCRDTLSRRSALPAWLGAIAVVVPLAALAPRVAQPADRTSSIDTLLPIPAPRTAPKRVARGPAPVVAVSVGRPFERDTLKGCTGDTKHTGSSTTQENDDLMIFMSSGGCSVRFAASGKFKFTPDFTDIASVSSGGYVTIDVDYGAHDRRVTIRPNNERIYKIDGDVKPYDAEAKAWVTDVLTYVLRRTGYQAEQRARWILDTKGIQGLVDEFGQLQGDYTRRIYYQAAVESGKLDAAGYERLITLAAQTIQSDYELAELLIAVSKAQPLTERMQAGFAEAAKAISSDYERHRVLSAALSRPGLTPAVQSSMLDAATGINSDYELATLLVELNDARPIDDKVRPAYFKAANSIESDYEHRRVLSAVVSRQGTTPAMLADVLNSAKDMQSDYELAELLTSIGANYPLDNTLRPAFFAAAGTIDSDYELGRTLNSVLRGQVTPEVALAVLATAKGLSSDHEMSELLIAVMQHAKLDDATRAAIRANAESIDSQYDRGRVYEALARE